MTLTPPAPTSRLLPLLAIVAAATLGATGSSSKPGAFPNGAVCAVSLSYDDSVPIHHQRVAPLLSAHGLHATFYLSINSLNNPEQWKAVAAQGHELGNHSLFHPCRREPPSNYGWLAEDYDLANYSPRRFRDELTIANKFIDMLDGGRPRTYGNNCTHLTIGSGDQLEPMDPILEKLFVAARGSITSEPVDPANAVFTRLGHYNGDGKTFEQLRAEIEAARARGAWIIYMFHGVGKETHNLYIDTEEHRRLVEWLDQERASIWTASVVEVAQHLKAREAK